MIALSKGVFLALFTLAIALAFQTIIDGSFPRIQEIFHAH